MNAALIPPGWADVAMVDEPLALALAALRDMATEADWPAVQRLARAVEQRAALLNLEATAQPVWKP